MRAALLVTLALVSSGCLGQSAEPADTPFAGAFVDPIVPDHDHADLDAHALWTDNMRLHAHTYLDEGGHTFASFGEMDWHEDVAVVAAQLQGEPSPLGAVVLFDISDPATPAYLGHVVVASQTHPLDVKFDKDGSYVYASVMGQIHAVDVVDPTAPRLAGSMLPPGAACHMSALGVVDGVEYFFCTGDPASLTVYRVVEAPGARSLAPVAVAPAQGTPTTSAGTFGVIGAPHDMTFQLDPVDERPLLVVSNRGFGVRVLDVSNPMLPVELGRWHGEGAVFFSNHLHTAMVTMIQDTRHLIVSPEILSDGNPPAIWILDATDYAQLTLVGEWVPPGEHVSPGFTFTTHQWQVANERLYLGYYHAGVWVLDLKTILVPDFRNDPARPDVLGYYLPHMPSVLDGQMVPNVWDLALKDGLMMVTDISSGLYVIHYDGDEIGDPTATGFA